MSVSEGFTKLAARAREAQEREEAAQEKARTDLERARTDLEQDVATARATAQAESERLRERGDEKRGEISAWWADVQRAWNKRIAAAREDIDAKKEKHDVHSAQRRAEWAEQDALYAIDFAYTTIDEAEYAALNAILTRMEADELSAKQ